METAIRACNNKSKFIAIEPWPEAPKARHVVSYEQKMHWRRELGKSSLKSHPISSFLFNHNHKISASYLVQSNGNSEKVSQLLTVIIFICFLDMVNNAHRTNRKLCILVVKGLIVKTTVWDHPALAYASKLLVLHSTPHHLWIYIFVIFFFVRFVYYFLPSSVINWLRIAPLFTWNVLHSTLEFGSGTIKWSTWGFVFTPFLFLFDGTLIARETF